MPENTPVPGTENLPFKPMETEVNIIPHVIIGGKKVDSKVYGVSNRRMHNAGEILCRMMIFACECRSAGAPDTISPNERRIIWDFWTQFKAQIEHMKAARSSAVVTSHDKEYAYSLPAANYIQKVRSLGIKAVCLCAIEVAEVMGSTSGANAFDRWVSDSALDNIDATIGDAEEDIKRWVGIPPGVVDGVADDTAGVELKGMARIGKINPDPDLEYVRVKEPSIDGASGHMPDSPDR